MDEFQATNAFGAKLTLPRVKADQRGDDHARGGYRTFTTDV